MELFTYLMAKNDHNTSVNKDLFSYLLGKNQSGTYTDYSGTSLSINNTKKGKMKVNLLGNTSQTGTPTPSSPIPVNVVSGDNTIVSTGKNLLDTSKFTSSTYLTSIDANTSEINVSPPAYTTFPVIFNNLNIQAGNYTIWCEVVSGTYTGGNLVFVDLSGASYGFEFAFKNDSTHIKQINLSNGLSQLKIYNPMCSEAVKLKIWLVKGSYTSSTMPTYEPYTSTSYPIHLGEHWLGWIGDYKDGFFKAINGDNTYDNLDSATKESLTYGEWYLEKKIGKYTFPLLTNVVGIYDNTSSETQASKNGTFAVWKWTINNNLSNNTMFHTIAKYEYKSNIDGNTTAQNNLSDNSFCMRQGTNDRIYFRCSEFTGKTGNQIAQELVGTLLYYVLSSPTYTQITGTLKDELEAVHNAKSYKGTTNINQINNDLPFNMDVSVKVGN